MKRFVLGMTALVSAVSMNAQDDIDSLLSVELQGVQVVSTRASKKTPVAYTNMSQKELKAVNFGQDVPYLLSLTPSVTMTLCQQRAVDADTAWCGYFDQRSRCLRRYG